MRSFVEDQDVQQKFKDACLNRAVSFPDAGIWFAILN